MRDAGSVALVCDEHAGRTRIAAIRAAGLSRSSRSFPDAGGGRRVVLATLGPGVLAGDRYAVTGDVRARASLTAAGQMATPVFAGALPSCSDAHWRVAPGATVTLIAEPLLLEPGSAHEVTTGIDLAGDGIAIIAETFALRGPARLRMRSTARIDGVLAYRDALDIDAAEGAAGTVALVCANAALRGAFVAVAEKLAAAGAGHVRLGIGETDAAVVVRLAGTRVWDVRALAVALAEAARPA